MYMAVLLQLSGVTSRIRLVHQFHFTAWPDHGTPKYPTGLLEFRKKVNQVHQQNNNQPMLVHCRYAQHIIRECIGFDRFLYYSAGIGRSGTFIAIDTEIQRIENENVINVYNCVLRMRFWRNYMVQTLVSSLILNTCEKIRLKNVL